MDRVKRLIIEAHRRSLWQVLGVYLFSAWIVLQVVGELTRSAGLPEWVPSFALVLLLIGLPIVVATAVVQEGGPAPAGPEPAPSDPPAQPVRSDEAAIPLSTSFLERHLTWKRAILGGIAAFSLLGLLVAAYLLSWATGIGPVGSLVAQGAMEEGDRVVLADFQAPAEDPALGAVVTDALRIDLLDTRVLRVLEASEVQEVLQRMQVDVDGPLTPEMALEVALRDGIKAVLEGEVARAGTGYVLTATLRHAESGRSLAAFRENARDADEVIPAIDRLSRRIRERVGESLRSIHAGQRLEDVTTSSLDALRIFSEANRAFERADYPRSISLLEEALELDPDFAMAWRRLAVVLNNVQMDPVRQVEAATRAYELRERLSEKERHLTSAFYHSQVVQDRAATMEAYRRVLEIDPDDPRALNNLGNAYGAVNDYASADELYERAALGPGTSSVAFGNLIRTRMALGRVEAAREALEAFAERFPDNRDLPDFRFWVLLREGDEAAARAEVEPLLFRSDLPLAIRVRAHDRMARLALWQGQIGQAREHLATAERMALEAGPAFHWLRRVWTAHAEAFVGDPERAGRIILQGLADGSAEAVPPTSQFYFGQTLILGMSGHSEEVEASIRRWEAEAPPGFQGREVRTSLGALESLVLLHRGDAEGAVQLLEEGRSALACSTCLSEVMGWALRDSGRLREAAEEWETAASMEEGQFEISQTLHLWATERLGPLYEELGEPERALVHYRRLVELWDDADSELQPRVEHARERIRALSGGTG